MGKRNNYISTITPDKVANISLWFDANDTSNITKDGSNFVSQWNDKSANAYHVTQPTGANQPLWNSSGFGTNSRPYISFNGTTQILRRIIADVFSADSSGTMFIIYTRTDRTNVNNASIISSADTGATTRLLQFFQSAASYQFGVNQNNGVGADNISFSTTPMAANNTPMMAIMQSNGTAYSGRVNSVGQSINIVSGANTGDWFADTSNRDNLVIGGLIRTTTAYGAYNIAEIVYYSSILTTDQLTQIETYFINKYGAF